MNAHSEVVTVSAPRDDVFAFMARIENLPKWAIEFCQELKVVDGLYKVVSPGGELDVDYRTDPATGVIDIFVGPTRETMGLFPMRVVPLPGNASAILMSMFQAPGMPDEEFLDQAESLHRELTTLARTFRTLAPAA